MASDAVVGNTLSTQTSMAAPGREAGCIYCFPSEEPLVFIGSESRDHSFESTPHPAYGSEFSTDGNRLVRAIKGNGAACRFTPRPVLQHPGPFPVSSTARTIGEQKAKVKSISESPFFRLIRKPYFLLSEKSTRGCAGALRAKSQG